MIALIDGPRLIASLCDNIMTFSTVAYNVWVRGGGDVDPVGLNRTVHI